MIFYEKFLKIQVAVKTSASGEDVSGPFCFREILTMILIWMNFYECIAKKNLENIIYFLFFGWGGGVFLNKLNLQLWIVFGDRQFISIWQRFETEVFSHSFAVVTYSIHNNERFFTSVWRKWGSRRKIIKFLSVCYTCLLKRIEANQTGWISFYCKININLIVYNSCRGRGGGCLALCSI